MSKKLKLSSLSTSRRWKSAKQQNDTVIPSEKSPYFGLKKENIKDSNSTKIRNNTDQEIVSEAIVSETSNESEKSHDKRKTKKRNVPLKIEYDEFQSDESKNKNDNEDLIKKRNEEGQNEKLKKDSGNGSSWMPANWKSTLENIKEMRKHKTAPVDEMGCHKCADPNASDAVFRYQCLLALMLSSQTKDQVTHAAMKRLISYGCTPSIITATSNDIIIKLIHPVGFANKKADYIKKTSVILLDKYNGDIPKTIDELCNLPGVGPKMAHICMQIAWGEISGIGVDTHVHRISNRLNWVKKPTKTPEDTRRELEDWLPKNLWNDINHLLVGFGQEICLPRFPKCTECLNKNICPFVKKK